MVRRLLRRLPPLLLTAWVRPWPLVGAADWLKVFGGRVVRLALGHRHAGVGGAVLMEGVGVGRRREGKGAVASALARGVQDVLVAAGNLAAELDAADATGEHRGRLVSEDGSREALSAAQPAGVDGRLPLEGRAERRSYRDAILGAVGGDGGDLWDVPQSAASRNTAGQRAGSRSSHSERNFHLRSISL